MIIAFFFVNREEFLAKIERRVKDYKIEVINEPRTDKKLLVLDIDYTLFGRCINSYCLVPILKINPLPLKKQQPWWPSG